MHTILERLRQDLWSPWLLQKAIDRHHVSGFWKTRKKCLSPRKERDNMHNMVAPLIQASVAVSSACLLSAHTSSNCSKKSV